MLTPSSVNSKVVLIELLISDTNAYFEQLNTDIESTISECSCDVLRLGSSYSCLFSRYVAYPTSTIDLENLFLKQHIYNDIKDVIERNQAKGDTTMHYQTRRQSAICINNTCQLQ